MRFCLHMIKKFLSKKNDTNCGKTNNYNNLNL